MTKGLLANRSLSVSVALPSSITRILSGRPRNRRERRTRGGFAYGRVNNSANWVLNGGTGGISFFNITPPFGVVCTVGVPCFAGGSSSIRTGWTAGGGAEYLLDQHWSAKIEYQFVDLGSETVRITGLVPCPPGVCGLPTPPLSNFNAFFRDQFNVVRLGLNYRF